MGSGTVTSLTNQPKKQLGHEKELGLTYVLNGRLNG